MTLKIIWHFQSNWYYTQSIVLLSLHREESTWMKLLNIEFYDNFIICLFLFYDRFYRSFGFYDSLPAVLAFFFLSFSSMMWFSLSHVWGLFYYCLFCFRCVSRRFWLKYQKLITHFSEETQKERKKISAKWNSVNLIDVYFFTTSIKLTIKYDFLSFE